MRRAFLALLLAVLSVAPASAQELYLFGGVIQKSETSDRSSSWALEYMQGLGKYTAFSVSWLNEGHLPNNHRDGPSVQIWGRTSALHPQLHLSAGIGPYMYYDTKLASEGRVFSDTHGYGAVFSIAATWHTDSRWLFQLRTNWIKTRNSIDTCSAMVGIGYQLDPPASRGPLAEASAQRQRTTENEITVFVGQTIVNSYDSEQSTAQSVEYRRGVARYIDWTIAWLNEGDNRLIRRNGIISQVWAVRAFLHDHLALGVGLGPYVLVDRRRSQYEDDDAVAGIITLTASCRFSPHWSVRASWNRITTNYDRDTDVIMAGPSYRF